jgi:hypothetical protein
MESLEFYTTCGVCDEDQIETVLEGVGEYDREANTLHAPACPVCGHEGEFQGWLDECEDCGELHYEVDGCEEEANK